MDYSYVTMYIQQRYHTTPPHSFSSVVAVYDLPPELWDKELAQQAPATPLTYVPLATAVAVFTSSVLLLHCASHSQRNTHTPLCISLALSAEEPPRPTLGGVHAELNLQWISHWLY